MLWFTAFDGLPTSFTQPSRDTETESVDQLVHTFKQKLAGTDNDTEKRAGTGWCLPDLTSLSTVTHSEAEVSAYFSSSSEWIDRLQEQ